MPILIVQLNHPGHQKDFIIGNGYHQINNQIIREWNKCEPHYRKFIRNDGQYLSSLNAQPQYGKLLFWGEWEGNSIFIPINKGQNGPNGIHEPFHSIKIRGKENTDPYVYGDFFKYAICKQTGQLCNLDKLSLNIFYLDTVFVVKCYDTAIDVCNTSAKAYSLTYREETLEQLDNEYLGPNPSKTKKLYHGLSWWDNKEYFSFVPCKLNDNSGFERLKIDLKDTYFNLSRYPSGKSYLKHPNKTPQEIWKRIIEMAFKQNFYLGIGFKEPQINNTITAEVRFIGKN